MEIPDLTVYINEGWRITVRPATHTRQWMDNTPEGYSYRCLPLTIANSSGWEILNPFPFNVFWNGGSAQSDLIVNAPSDKPKSEVPVSLFGSGILTFHVFGLIRTSPGWNLWVGPSPNYFKDGISCMTGIIETDWSPFSFTVNWKMTRPGMISFEENEPFCFFFPVQRNLVNQITPKLEPLSSNPELRDQFTEWSKITDEFHDRMAKGLITDPKASWQKYYFRGTNIHGKCPISDHQTKMRPKPFSST